MKHHLSLRKFPPKDAYKGGYRLKVTKNNFSPLQGMSFYKLFLHPRAVREPHWHTNADELGYCLKGKLLISFYGNHNMRESFVVQEGEAFFIPSGALHSIENIGESAAEVLLQLSHEEPEEFNLSTAFGMFSDAVLGNTWNIDDNHFKRPKQLAKPSLITLLEQSTPIHKEERYSSEYHFALEASSPLLNTPGGAARVCRQNVWPILKRQAVYSLRLNKDGMREPHWHPETAEMGYIAEGVGRMSILSPSGDIDTYRMEQGDIYFIPKAYPHHIENLNNNSELHMVIFFDQPMPQDIGFTGSLKSFSDSVLSSATQCDPKVFANLPTYYEDLFIVEKKNPVD